MKAIKHCPHIKHDPDQIAKELFRKEHDGRFFVVHELCKTCFTEWLIRSELRRDDLN